jgi:monoamine oxidase
MSSRKIFQCDVAVVGAGMAGLSAARALEQQGFACRVIEARDRVGGRVHTNYRDGRVIVETGAEFLCHDMTELKALVLEAGLALSPRHEAGDQLIAAKNEEPVRLTGGASGKDRPSASDMAALIGSADCSMKELIRRHLPDAEEALAVSSSMSELLSVNVDRLSAMAVTDIRRRYLSTQSDLQLHVPGGIETVAREMAGGLNNPVLLGNPVRSIALEGGVVRVLADRLELHARALVLAIPPPVVQRIAFAPALPPDVVKALDSYVAGSMIKIVLAYETPFWREAGLSGDVLFVDPYAINVSDASFEEDGQGRLVMFVGASTADDWALKTQSERTRLTLELLESALGPQASTPLWINEGVWVAESWSGGGYNAQVLLGGLPNAAEVLRDAEYRSMVFAGSEIAPQFPTLIEGAIRSGREAAIRVANLLER